jgi:hypothetical protein
MSSVEHFCQEEDLTQLPSPFLITGPGSDSDSDSDSEITNSMQERNHRNRSGLKTRRRMY